MAITNPALSFALREKQTISRVEVGATPVKAVIVRDGEEIKTPSVDTARIGDFIDRLKPLDRRATPRLVQQSIPAGTFVARGTPVDLVFVRPSDISIGILEGSHTGMKAKAVDEVLTMLDKDPALKDIVKKGDASNVTAAEKATVLAALQQEGITVDDTQADLSFDRAFSTLVNVRVFQ